MNLIASPPIIDGQPQPALQTYRVYVRCTQLYELDIAASNPEDAREQALELSHYGELGEDDIYRERHEVFDCELA
jgi:hypothetical protein